MFVASRRGNNYEGRNAKQPNHFDPTLKIQEAGGEQIKSIDASQSSSFLSAANGNGGPTVMAAEIDTDSSKLEVVFFKF